MLVSYKRGQGSIVLRVKLRDSSVSTGAGLTGLTFSSAGLIISTIADNESSATAYTQAGSTIETITTLGTFAAPTATKCRFKEVDATNHKGVYEIQIADARFAVSSAKSMIVSLSGATNLAQTDCLVPLTDLDPYDAVRGGMTALPNANAAAAGGLWILGANAAAATTLTGTAASGATPATPALKLTGGAASTTGGGVAGQGLYALGGAGAASTNGAASGFRSEGGGTTTVTGGRGVHFVGTGSLADIGADTNGTALGAVTCSTFTASGAVAFQSTFAVTNGFTVGTFTVSGATTLTGQVFATSASNSINLGTDSITSTQIAASAVTEIWAGSTAPTAVQIRQEMDSNSTGLAAIYGKVDTEVGTLQATLDALVVTVGVAGAGLTAADDTVMSYLTTNVGLLGANLTAADDAVMLAIAALSIPTAAQNAAALLDLTNGIETSITPRQALRLILASAAGKLSGAATTTITIRNVGDSKDRITATVDADGNRTAVTTDGT